jgi:hypothetical protein
MRLPARPISKYSALLTVLGILLLLALASPLSAQSTPSTGGIQGTVTDASGAVVPNANVTITSKDTGRSITLKTNTSGSYTSGSLTPGSYIVKIENQGFKSVELPITVQVGTTHNGNAKLAVGQQSETVTVEAAANRVNTEQATVQGVITRQQIDQLPTNGRNFLEIAQLEPGVQIQDASNFDPTKGGFTGISVGGRAGRTTRIELDGLDISDETVGTTVSNVSSGAIQEFSISQSTLDMSTELTSSGAVNVATRTGTNSYHGEGFYQFRDKALAATFPGGVDAPFQRNQFGGSLGGFLIKDKLFWFGNAERVKQDLGSPITLSNFPTLSGLSSTPFKEVVSLGRLDWNISNSVKMFYRINYDNNDGTTNTLPNYSSFLNTNNAVSHAVGADMTTGTFSHTIRYGYTKFTNHISDAPNLVNDLFPGAQVRVGDFRGGTNPLAPQATFQTNNQIKYDGSKITGRHTIRYGVGYNHINGGGFANFFGIAPSIRSLPSQTPFNIFPGGANNPLNYPVTQIVLGNGQGFFTEKSGFGLPAGGQSDNRVQFYFGDTWKILPNFTLTAGIRYVRDTGRTDADIPPIPCSALDASLFSTPPPCPPSGQLLDLFGDNLGGRVNNPNNNWAPTLGIVWDPFNSGKTVFRAGGGLYYENAIFNNVLFDRPARLAQGLFNATPVICPTPSVGFPGGNQVTTTPGGLNIGTQVCGQAIGSVAAEVIALQQQLQAAVAAAGTSGNPNFVGNTLAQGGNSTGNNMFAPNYRSPRSWQMNVGMQQELRSGMILSVDYLRNVGIGFLQAVDTNHVGDARFLNKTAAQNAIAATLGQFGAANIDQAIAAGATIQDFAANGLDSGKTFLAAFPSTAFGLAPEFGAAFPGINPLVGENEMFFSNGRSVYNALQVGLRQTVQNPLRGFRNLNLQVSYSLSRFVTTSAGKAAQDAGDQDFINNAGDFRDPNKYSGPSSFDRTHQLSAGVVFDVARHGPRISFVGRVGSPLASTLYLEDGFRSGEVFYTDVTGDGTTGDILPGTTIGDFGRNIHADSINNTLNKFNSTVAGQLTPHAQALVAAGLFTPAQLTALNAGIEPRALAPPGQVNLDWTKNVDLRVAWPIKITERLSIEPSASLFNLFNFRNFDVNPTTKMTGVLTSQADATPQNFDGTGPAFGTPGSVTGTVDRGVCQSDTDPTATPYCRTNRAAQSTGVFSSGSPRQAEFGLRIIF